jgi:xanthine dehydrogenase YagS FAD-binding subunit
MSILHAEIRAGGTDLSERRRSGVSRGEIIDLDPTAEMTEIAWNQMGAARIGALVSIATIAADTRLRQAYPGLVAAAAGLATPQIRTIATLGGNLAQRTRCWYYRNPHLRCLKGRWRMSSAGWQSPLRRRLRPGSMRRAAPLELGHRAIGLRRRGSDRSTQ